MNIGNKIYNLWQTLAVSNFDTKKVYPNIIEQGIEFPAVVYEISSTSPENTKQTTSKLDTIAINFYIFSNDFDVCQSIAEGSRTIFDGHRDLQNDIDSIIFIASHSTFDNSSKTHIFIDTYEIRVKK